MLLQYTTMFRLTTRVDKKAYHTISYSEKNAYHTILYYFIDKKKLKIA